VPSLSIERMLAADLPDVLVIERASFSMPWSRGAFLYEIEQNQVARCWVGRDAGRLVGYICLWDVAEELHVTNVAVHPDARRRGIARALLESVFGHARAVGSRMVLLEVRPSNTEAIALYDSFGFRAVGRRRGYYYDTGEDALVMEALVNSGPRDADASHEPRLKGKWR
jgi:[ribosomal protein S18]-alanine N-acetyltransferase